MKGPKPKDPILRWDAKVDRNGPVPEHRPELGPCWLWTGHLNNKGYPLIDMNEDGRWSPRYAHRMAYGWFVEPLIDGLTIDHLCYTPACVNPHHLEQVTHRVNMHRSRGKEMQAHLRGECLSGHAMTEENTYNAPDGRRMCRACIRLRGKRTKRPA